MFCSSLPLGESHLISEISRLPQPHALWFSLGKLKKKKGHSILWQVQREAIKRQLELFKHSYFGERTEEGHDSYRAVSDIYVGKFLVDVLER